MQQFPCPFCGLRDENEFHFAGEAGVERPEPAKKVSDAQWANYLYQQKNIKGSVCEIWIHTPCREVFVMHRDSVTMVVHSSEALREWPQ